MKAVEDLTQHLHTSVRKVHQITSVHDGNTDGQQHEACLCFMSLPWTDPSSGVTSSSKTAGVLAKSQGSQIPCWVSCYTRLLRAALNLCYASCTAAQYWPGMGTASCQTAGAPAGRYLSSIMHLRQLKLNRAVAPLQIAQRLPELIWRHTLPHCCICLSGCRRR